LPRLHFAAIGATLRDGMSDSTAARTRDRALVACCVFIALAAAALAWHSASLFGMAVDGDSIFYVSAGVSLAEGRGLVTCLDEVFSLWPPLYSTVAAALELVGVDAFPGLRVLHLVAYAATILLTARLCWVLSASHVAAALAALAAALTSRIHEFAILVAAEGFFLPLVLAALLAALDYARESTRGRFAALVAFSALACLQRYVGVALVASIALWLLAFAGGVDVRARLRCAALYAVTSLAPLFAWFARNRLVEDAWTGGRDPAEQSLGEVLWDALSTLLAWAGPDGWPAWTGWVALGLGVASVAVALRSERTARNAASLALLFAALHLALVVALGARFQMDRVNDRLLLPLLPVSIALVFAAVGALARTRALVAAAAPFVLVALLASASRLDERRALWLTDGAGGFSTRLWREHAIALELARHALAAPCWSNAPEFVWLLQRRNGRFLRAGAKAWERAGRDAALSGGALVWFQDGGRPKAFPEQLAPFVSVEPLAQSEDGLVAKLVVR
jgi:hypothetical protein